MIIDAELVKFKGKYCRFAVLEEGEQVKCGDEYLNSKGEWKEVNSFGYLYKKTQCPVRRLIPLSLEERVDLLEGLIQKPYSLVNFFGSSKNNVESGIIDALEQKIRDQNLKKKLDALSKTKRKTK